MADARVPDARRAPRSASPRRRPSRPSSPSSSCSPRSCARRAASAPVLSPEERHALAHLPKAVGGALALEPRARGARAALPARARTSSILGRGLHYPVALEGALKLKEISYIHAEGYPAGEMKHGPIALDRREHAGRRARAARRAGARRRSRTCARSSRATASRSSFGTRPDDEVAAIADHVILVPETIPELQPILSVVPLQLLAYHVAVRRGCDVDQPRNLAKSVTVE